MLKLKFQRKTTIFILVIILILVLSHYTGLGRFTNKYVTLITNPVIRVANYISTSLSDFVSLYLNKTDLNTANDELRHKLINLARQNTELELIKQENEYLKKELEFLSDYEYNYTLAHILGYSLDYDVSQVLIDKGSAHGLKPGLAVTTDQGVIIGKIIKTEGSISHLKFLIDNSSKLSALVIAQESASGIAHGQHNINLKIDMLPKDIPIKPGDLVTTSGLESDIPAGLIIGHISKVDTSQEKFWQEALIEPAVDYHSIRLVTIILPQN